MTHPEKTGFKLFDFFGNCEFFETEFNYDEILKLPQRQSGKTVGDGNGQGPSEAFAYDIWGETSSRPSRNSRSATVG